MCTHATMLVMKLLMALFPLLLVCLIGCGESSDEKLGTNADGLVTDSKTNSTVVPNAQVKPPSRGPEISLEVEERDFGVIWDFQPVTTTFPFTNTGTKTLVITRLQAGCGCTKPIADKTVLQPGESGTITVTFDPNGKADKQDKKVTIFSNSVRSPEKGFLIRSYVKQFVNIEDKFLKLNEMTLGQPHSVEFDFFPADPNFEILSMTGIGKHGQYISGQELDMPEGSPRRIRITVSPNMPWGAFHSQLKIIGRGKKPDGSAITHDFAVFANGKTFGKIKTDNYIISIGTIQQGGSFEKSTSLFHADGEPFKVLNTAVLQPTVSGITSEATPNIDGSYTIVVRGKLPQSHQGPINAELMVKTDLPGEEEILKLRIAGVVPKKRQI